MRIVNDHIIDPSREDAVRLKRSERDGVLAMIQALSLLEQVEKEIPERIGLAEDGVARMAQVNEDANRLLTDIKVTIPLNQRMGIDHTGRDYQMRLMPSATPYNTSVVLTKEEFRRLVDLARATCKDCVKDDYECETCELFTLLTDILPVDDYHMMALCPYNLGEWKN